VPYGIVTGHGRIFTAHALLPGAVVALLPGRGACASKSEAPGRIPRGLLSILASTEPAGGAILGLIARGGTSPSRNGPACWPSSCLDRRDPDLATSPAAAVSAISWPQVRS
jgi:hypothetical protein